MHFAVFGSLLRYGFRPNACDQDVCCLVPAEQIVTNRVELHLCTALSEEDGEVVWNVEHLSEAGLGPLRDLSELFTPMTNLHDTHACALPIEHLTLGKPEDFFWQTGWSRSKVEYFFAFIGKLLVREIELRSLIDLKLYRLRWRLRLLLVLWLWYHRS